MRPVSIAEKVGRRPPLIRGEPVWGKGKATRSEIIERNGKIVKDYEDGLSFEQLSEKYGLCVRTCYRALDEEQQAQRIAEEQDHTNLVDKIVAEYQKNTAVRDIAQKVRRFHIVL